VQPVPQTKKRGAQLSEQDAVLPAGVVRTISGR
jgi:hypothetical protein